MTLRLTEIDAQAIIDAAIVGTSRHGFPPRSIPVSAASTVSPIIQVYQLNPHRVYAFNGLALRAVHRVRWVMRSGEWLAVEKLLADFHGRKEAANG